MEELPNLSSKVETTQKMGEKKLVVIYITNKNPSYFP
jgi:hypothetical protein